MEIKYIWIKKYKNIENQHFVFDTKTDFHFSENPNFLSINPQKKNDFKLFPDNISNITALIGKNGSGKSSIIETLISKNNIEKLIVTDNNTIFLTPEIIYNFTSKNFPIRIEFNPLFSAEKTQIYNRLTDKLQETLKKEWGNIVQIDFKIDNKSWKLKMFKNLKARHFYENIIYYSTFLNYRFETKSEIKDISLTYLIKKDKEIFLNNSNDNENAQFNSDIKANYYETLNRQINFFNKIKHNNKIPFPKAKSIYVNFNDFEDDLLQNPELYSKLKKTKLRPLVFSDSFSSIKEFTETISRLEIYSIILSEHIDWEKIEKNESEIWENTYLNYLQEQANDFENNKSESGFNWHKAQYQNVKAFFEYLREKENSLRINPHPHNYIDISIENEIDLAKKIIELYSKCNFFGNFLSFKWNYNFSSGEKALLNLFANFNTIIEKKDYVILIDEGEAFFHPNWQRKFITIFLDLTKLLFPKKTIQLIITTHSPFIISNLPENNIIFFDRYTVNDQEVVDDNQNVGNCKVVKDINHKTFGANIHILLSDNFFMDNLIGEFAKTIIDDLFTFLTSDKSKYSGNLTEQKAKDYINLIGEPIIKRYLTDLYYKKYTNNSDYEIIDNEIERLQELKNKLKK